MNLLPQFSRLARGVLPALALLGLAAACKRIPLYEPRSGVYLKLEIQLEDGDRLPEKVRVCFYDPLTHVLSAEDYLPAEGGFVDVPAGTYDLMVYSLGCETTRVTDSESRGAAYAYTGSPGSKVRTRAGDGGEAGAEYPVIYEPDHLYVGCLPGVVVPVRAELDRTVVLVCGMSTLLETYTFEARFVEGAERIREADVYITGQAPGKYLWDRRFPNKACALLFRSRVDTEKGKLHYVFRTFGKLHGIRSDVYLNVLATSLDGGRYQWTFDVTDQFDNPDNTLHEIIVEEPIVVPESGSGGFLPTVGDWNTEIIEVPLS